MGCQVSNVEIITAQYNKCSFSIKNHTEHLLYVFPYQNNKLLSCSSNSYKLLNLDTKREEMTFNFEEKVTAMYYHSNQLKLLCGYESGVIEIVDITKKKRNKLIAHEVPVTCMFLKSNGLFVSADSSGLIVIWDLKKRDEVTLFQANKGKIVYLYELNDKKLLSIGSNDIINIHKPKKYSLDLSWSSKDTTCLIQLNDERLIYNSKQAICAITFLALTTHLASKENQKSPKPVTCIPNAHDSSITYLLYLNCKTEFASASKDTTIKIWEIQGLTCKTILFGHTDTINFLFEKRIIKASNKAIDKTKANNGLTIIKEKKSEKRIQKPIKAITEETKVDEEDLLKEETTLLSCGNDYCVKIWIK